MNWRCKKKYRIRKQSTVQPCYNTCGRRLKRHLCYEQSVLFRKIIFKNSWIIKNKYSNYFTHLIKFNNQTQLLLTQKYYRNVTDYFLKRSLIFFPSSRVFSLSNKEDSSHSVVPPKSLHYLYYLNLCWFWVRVLQQSLHFYFLRLMNHISSFAMIIQFLCQSYNMWWESNHLVELRH